MQPSKAGDDRPDHSTQIFGKLQWGRGGGGANFDKIDSLKKFRFFLLGVGGQFGNRKFADSGLVGRPYHIKIHTGWISS